MLRRVALLVALVAIATFGASGCGDDGDDSGSEEEEEGEPISEPICDFLGLSDDVASGVLGFEVTTASAVGDDDPSGGNCTLTPANPADGFEVTVAVFPDTEESFVSFLEDYSTRPGRAGTPLWTEPVEISGVGDLAYTLQSPEGGFDNVWVFTNGYRFHVTDQNTTDLPGAPETLESLAQEVASNL